MYYFQAELPEVTNVLPELIIPPRPTALIPPGHVRTSMLQVSAAIGQSMSCTSRPILLYKVSYGGLCSLILFSDL